MQHRFSKRKRILMIPLFALMFLAMFSLFSLLVMYLWNAILPQVLHAGVINFWQAAGLLLLAKILFGSFGGWRRKRGEWRQRMFEKWDHMTPEDREKFKERMKARCAKWGGPFTQQQTAQNREAGAGAGTE